MTREERMLGEGDYYGLTSLAMPLVEGGDRPNMDTLEVDGLMLLVEPKTPTDSDS